MDNVTLIGMPGSGKSTVGVLLAKALGYQFVDTDLLIQQREGALLQDVLDALGVEAFLDLEGEVLSGLACTGTVIAPGGSAVCRPGAIGHLRQLGRVVYLRLSMGMGDILSMTMDMTGAYTQGTSAPETQPPEGAAVVDLLEMGTAVPEAQPAE